MRRPEWQPPHIAGNLQCCAALREVSLHEQAVKPLWVSALSTSLLACKQITRFVWKSLSPGPESLAPLVRALARCLRLRQIDLIFVELSEDAIVGLCTALRGHPALLSLTRRGVGLAGRHGRCGGPPAVRAERAMGAAYAVIRSVFFCWALSEPPLSACVVERMSRMRLVTRLRLSGCR